MHLRSILILLAAGGCCRDFEAAEAPPCTPAAAGFSDDDAIAPPIYAPPEGCFLTGEEGQLVFEVETEVDLQELLDCPDIDPKPPSGVDFATQKVVSFTVVTVARAPAPPPTWAVRDDGGVRLGIVDDPGCGGAAPTDVAGPLLVVGIDEEFEVVRCTAGGCSGNTCGNGFSQPP